MTDQAAIERRLAALERAVTGEAGVEGPADGRPGESDRVEDLEDSLADIEARVSELEAATRALRGYVGEVRSVNTDVERRADAALAAVENLEGRIADATQFEGSPGTSVGEEDLPAGDAVVASDGSSTRAGSRRVSEEGGGSTGPEMPVPEARDEVDQHLAAEHERAREHGDTDVALPPADGQDDGLFDRVRDAL